MEKIIKAAVDRGASDLHIKAGDVFRARIHGDLVPLTKQSLTPEQTRAIALHLMRNEDDKARIDELLDYDCSWSAAGIGRFRVNIMKQRSSFSIIMRVIPWEVPSFEKLGLPSVLGKIAEAERGMVLVTGVTGSGKSSTMAALINYINQRESGHILTLENPIEFLHKDINCSVTQREIGSDTVDFKMGLRAALRQDPDVIMIGELRDAETIDTALKAAETGHVLMSTLHTPDAQSTIMRMMAMFPPEEQEVVRIRLAESLTAVVSQRLLPRKNGKGRVVAAEIMVNTPSIKDIIIEGTRIGEIKDFIAEGREQYGMQTFDQCLTDLVTSGEVTFETAKAASSNPSDFELKLKMFSRVAQSEDSNDIPVVEQPPAAETPQSVPQLDGLQSSGLDFLGQ
ncbi:MAG TPA: type IV pilus twitching motility protein PilT [Gemmatimonadaceae bacterium]